jgi:glucose/arabinose dehydrogenase
MYRRAVRVAVATCTFLGVISGNSRVWAQSEPVLPRGFHATVRAQGLVTPTSMAIGPDGRLYVAQENGLIRAVGKSGITTVASGFTVPLGLAWHKHKLYVSSTGMVSTLSPARGYTSFTRRTIVQGLPTGRHQNDNMAFHGGWMYLGVGSTCNACSESDPRSATIMRFHADGTHAQIFAHGLRNPFGLAFRPSTGVLYATDNGRDDFNDSVPDEFNRIVRGGVYGWPNCWGNGGGSGCKGTIGPQATFEPHASADGFAFYTGHTFPASYRGDAFVAEFGQTVGVGTNGHRVKDVHWTGKRWIVSDFATGLSHPVDAIVGRDGSVLVADYGTGIIWRIQANGH